MFISRAFNEIILPFGPVLYLVPCVFECGCCLCLLLVLVLVDAVPLACACSGKCCDSAVVPIDVPALSNAVSLQLYLHLSLSVSMLVSG